MKTGRLMWVGPVLVLLASGELFAQSSIDSRVQKLEETIQALERRIASLEDQLREQNAPARVAPDRVSWRKLQKGMSEGDVEKLLGSPSMVMVWGIGTIWYYGYPDGGEVRFDAQKRTLVGWDEP